MLIAAILESLKCENSVEYSAAQRLNVCSEACMVSHHTFIVVMT